MKMNRKWQGGFSKAVNDSYPFQEYVKHGNCCFGYIGSYNRTPGRDKALETILRNTGLGDAGIATWLTSTSGRHLMDDVVKTTTLAKFKKRAKDSCLHAFQQVTVWSHPDHEGSFASTEKLKGAIRKAFAIVFIAITLSACGRADGSDRARAERVFTDQPGYSCFIIRNEQGEGVGGSCVKD